MARNEFPRAVRDDLGKRVSLRCSRPACRLPTTGPRLTESGYVDCRRRCPTLPPLRPAVRDTIKPLPPTSARLLRMKFGYASAARSLLTMTFCALMSRCCANGRSRRRHQRFEGWTPVPLAEYFPHPASAMRAPVPRIAGLTYTAARELLLDAGWQPRRQHWSYANERTFSAATARSFGRAGTGKSVVRWEPAWAHASSSFKMSMGLD